MAKNETDRLKAFVTETKTASTAPAQYGHGDKGGFIKITATLPPEVYQVIMTEVTRRKMSKERDPNMSAVIREAVIAHLGDGS